MIPARVPERVVIGVPEVVEARIVKAALARCAVRAAI